MTQLDLIVDLQFGSTGKGALAGYLSMNNPYECAVSANLPNAGHTAYSPEGYKFIHKSLPSGIFGDSLRSIGIGPGAAFTIDRLEEEWKGVCEYRDDVVLLIHEAAAIVRPEHKEAEQARLNSISSTMQGSAEAVISKMRRDPLAIAGHWELAITERLSKYGPVRVVNQNEWLKMMIYYDRILVEGSQGYSLGISAGFYPHCTSRECTPARILADCGLPVQWLKKTYGSARVHPIRVGNTVGGYSGDWYPDQSELTFGTLGVEEERTTVTGRVRRIATFSVVQIQEAMIACRPDEVFLNFAQYNMSDTARAAYAIDEMAARLGLSGVTLMGHGPFPTDIRSV